MILTSKNITGLPKTFGAGTTRIQYFTSLFLPKAYLLQKEGEVGCFLKRYQKANKFKAV